MDARNPKPGKGNRPASMQRRHCIRPSRPSHGRCCRRRLNCGASSRISEKIAAYTPFCGFDMIDSAEPGRPSAERLIQFANAGILVGPNSVQLKNANTGQTIDLNSSGPAPSITVQGGNTTIVATVHLEFPSSATRG